MFFRFLFIIIVFIGFVVPVKKANATIIITSVVAPVVGPVAAVLTGMGGLSGSYFLMTRGVHPGIIGGLVLLDDEGMHQSEIEYITRKIMNSYRDIEITVYQANDIAELIVYKLKLMGGITKEKTEIIFSPDEIAPVIESMVRSNPELANKIFLDFTEKTLDSESLYIQID